MLETSLGAEMEIDPMYSPPFSLSLNFLNCKLRVLMVLFGWEALRIDHNFDTLAHHELLTLSLQ